MGAYRITFHDEGGEPVAESGAEHPHDEAAIAAAGAHPHPHEMMLWEGDRLVAHFPARDPPA